MDVHQTANALVRYYRSEVIPDLVEEFDSWGFDRTNLATSDDTFYLFVVLASYDRRPFTYKAGYEAIWSEDPGSVRRLLESKRLHRRATVLSLSPEELRAILEGLIFTTSGLRLAYDRKQRTPGVTEYGRTIREIAEQTPALRESCLGAATEYDVASLHYQFDQIHGIGPTIAAKLVKYLLREMAIGEVGPSAFASVAPYLLPEYHNSAVIQRLRSHPSDGFPQHLLNELKTLGDPLAIDGLFHADRYHSGTIPAQYFDGLANAAS